MNYIKNNRITILMYIIVSAYILLGLILGIIFLNEWIYINNYPVNSIGAFVNKQSLGILDSLIILFASILYAIIWLIFKKLHKYLIMNFLMMISLISLFYFFHNFLYPNIQARIINNNLDELNKYSIRFLLLYLFLIVLAIMPLFITSTYVSGKTKRIGYNKINVFDLIVILISLILVSISLIDYVNGILYYQKDPSPINNILFFTS